MTVVIAHCLTADKSAAVPLKTGDVVFKREESKVNPTPLIVSGPGGFANTVHLREQHNNAVHKYVAGHVLVHGHEIPETQAMTLPKIMQTISKVEKAFDNASHSKDSQALMTVNRASPLLAEVKKLTKDMSKTFVPDNRLNELHSKLMQVAGQLSTQTGGKRRTSRKKPTYR